MGRATKDEAQVRLELALEEILNVKNMNVWISVKERPIGKILENAGVRKEYQPFVMKALTKLGLVEEEGERLGRRYIIKSQVIPDIKYLVKTIREESKEARRSQFSNEEVNKFDGYAESKKSDLRPKRVDTVDTVDTVVPTIKIKRPVIIPNLGDMRFVVLNDKIIEGKIISLRYDEEDKIAYEVRIVNEDYDSKKKEDMIIRNVPQYRTLYNLSVKDLFETPEIAADYLIRHAVRFK